MPKKNGIQVIKNMHSDNTEINYKTPALALTANALKSDIHKYLKAGFDDYIIKPFKEYELYNKLCNMLEIKMEMNSGISTKQSFSENKKEDKFNVLELQKAAGDNNDFFNTMLSNFINIANEVLETSSKALENENWQEMGEKAHKAIPSFKYFGLHHLALNFERIENLALHEKRYDELPDLIEQTNVRIKDIVKKAIAAKTID